MFIKMLLSRIIKNRIDKQNKVKSDNRNDDIFIKCVFASIINKRLENFITNNYKSMIAE